MVPKAIARTSMESGRYVFKCEIWDTEADEVIAQGSADIPNEKRTNKPVLGLEDLNEEAAEGAFWDMMRNFRNKVQPELEAEENAVDEDEETI